MCPAVAVNIEIKIPPEPLKIENLNGDLIDIPIPSSHIETSSIQVRLISNKKREGMVMIFGRLRALSRSSDFAY